MFNSIIDCGFQFCVVMKCMMILPVIEKYNIYTMIMTAVLWLEFPALLNGDKKSSADGQTICDKF